MQVDILRVRVGRSRDDGVISQEVIGQKKVSASSYAEAIIKAVTGRSCADAVGTLYSETDGQNPSATKEVVV